ncbi:hypothetical protein HK098_005829 [Nowakowskiella sp. JEL0407]|nr:hypothetical protein HK098_005829 [Nowakowskiella sp. JEL0407]
MEDFVQFELFGLSNSIHESKIIESKVSLFVKNLLQSTVPNYIWQKDSFFLNSKRNESKRVSISTSYFISNGSDIDDLICLAGKVRFGDCIDDEWFVVWILYQITERFKNAVARVWDTDGEFIFIETASVIPKWLDPTTSTNRVFVHNGKLHIIPIPTTPADIGIFPAGKNLNLETAIGIVKRNENKTVADLKVQEIIEKKILGYPKRASENIHRARCIVPNSVAKILWHNPQLVAPAVASFYERDPAGLRACSLMRNFSPEAETVETTVKFTKVLYAQLVGQKFIAPVVFNRPSETDSKYKAFDLGMKLTCGFEMLFTNKQIIEASTAGSGVIEVHSSLESNPKWIKYHQNLTKLGYYKDEIQGSKKYKDLDFAARERFINDNYVPDSSTPLDLHPQIPNYGNPYTMIKDILDFSDPADVSYRIDEPEDNDDWINVSLEEIDAMIQERSGGEQATADDLLEDDFEDDEDDDLEIESDGDEDERRGMNPVEKKEYKRVREMVNTFNTFINSESSADGVELNKDVSEANDPNGMNFDPDRLINILMETIGADPKLHLPTSETLSESDEDEDSVYSDENIKDLMTAMDLELSTTSIGQDFEKVEKGEIGEEGIEPVNLDLNLVKNLLESFASQNGLPGPASNLLGALNVRIPKLDEKQ